MTCFSRDIQISVSAKNTDIISADTDISKNGRYRPIPIPIPISVQHYFMESEPKNLWSSILCSKIRHFWPSFSYTICPHLPMALMLSYFLKSWPSWSRMILPEFARDLGQKIDYFFEVEVILEVNIDILEKKWWNQGKIQKFQNLSKTNQ